MLLLDSSCLNCVKKSESWGSSSWPLLTT